MALAFEKARLQITNETGIHEDTITKGFDFNIREVENRPVVEVAIQSFKLDLAGNARPTDVVQVTASLADVGAETVTVRVRTNYSGGPYSGEVVVLIIADLVVP